MSAGPAIRRRNQAIAAFAAGVILLALGAASVWRDAALGARPDVSGPVVPGWRDAAADAERIEIITSDEQFMLVRSEAGWTMPSRGDYAVRPERIAELDEALGGLQYDRAMTRDPEKFPRLGLDDPIGGGAGIRINVLDSEGTAIAALIVGRDRDEGGVYLRTPGGERAYSATGTLPELGDAGRWLGLEFWDLDPGSVAQARIRPEAGPAWAVQRAGIAQRNFELVEPEGWRLVTGGAANGPATAGARLRFRDVKPAAALTGAFAARHQAVTFSGIAYDLTFTAEGEERWAVIEVRAAADDAAERVERLERFVDGWAFRVSEDAYERMTRPLPELAEPAPVEPVIEP
ncbi:MAG: DUF4340 domain-containing protein [Oceanicaulis sp.]